MNISCNYTKRKMVDIIVTSKEIHIHYIKIYEYDI